MIKTIKIRHLCLVGNIVKTEDSRVLESHMNGKFDGRRSHDRWLKCVQNDFKTIEVESCKNKIRNRSIWRYILDQAKLHRFLVLNINDLQLILT